MAMRSVFSLTVTRRWQQTAINMARAFIVVLVLMSACSVDCRICTRMTLEKQIKTQTYPGECQQSYQARCGWFSTKMCTFNETVPCLKQQNRTITFYRVVEDCCPGYYKDSEGKCRSDSERGQKDDGADKTSQGQSDFSDLGGEGRVTVSYDSSKEEHGVRYGHSNSHDDDDDDDDDKFFLGISHGAYAGIVCGVLFVACVALLVALHYRKRRLRQAKMNTLNSEQEMTQKQQMIPLEKTESPAVNT